MLASHHSISKLKNAHIAVCEAFRSYVRLHASPATHLLHVSMNTIEAVFDSDRLLRTHRAHIVNVRRIAQLW
jgi:two-component system LytT family response regulator